MRGVQGAGLGFGVGLRGSGAQVAFDYCFDLTAGACSCSCPFWGLFKFLGMLPSARRARLAQHVQQLQQQQLLCAPLNALLSNFLHLYHHLMQTIIPKGVPSSKWNSSPPPVLKPPHLPSPIHCAYVPTFCSLFVNRFCEACIRFGCCSGDPRC